MGVTPQRGCPYDCGLCTEHEQHTCIGLVELTESCNLKCPMCYSASGPGGKHLSSDECRRAIDRLVEVEGRPEVLQLSGGEPTVHPEFLEVLAYACAQPIDIVMINSNGIRFARDREFVERVAEHRNRIEIYLQFDGFRDSTYRTLRGEPLAEVKQQAVEALGRAGIRVILVTTLQPDVNEDEVGAIVRFGLARTWVTGVSLQPATYSGRTVLPAVLERRITFPDVVREICEQTDGLFRREDFMPLPCAHPNCHTLTYAYRSGGRVVPLLRFIDARRNLDLLANGITFTRARARNLIERYLGSLGCCASGGCSTEGEPVPLRLSPSPGTNGTADFVPSNGSGPGGLGVVSGSTGNGHGHGAEGGLTEVAGEFFARALAEQLTPSDVFRITITSFLDAYNFDVRRVMKCCIHHVLPSGHVVPFCAYNVLYRNGHVGLPVLDSALAAKGILTAGPR
jgi:uncharacterized radical SAM superfamily Fe-S cluster-containing enzyme